MPPNATRPTHRRGGRREYRLADGGYDLPITPPRDPAQLRAIRTKLAIQQKGATMAKTNKITQVKPNRARSERPDPQRLSKLFNLKRPGGNPSPTNPPFSKTNQPKKRGRPPGVQNLFTREIKEAAVNAAV